MVERESKDSGEEKQSKWDYLYLVTKAAKATR